MERERKIEGGRGRYRGEGKRDIMRERRERKRYKGRWRGGR